MDEVDQPTLPASAPAGRQYTEGLETTATTTNDDNPTPQPPPSPQPAQEESTLVSVPGTPPPTDQMDSNPQITPETPDHNYTSSSLPPAGRTAPVPAKESRKPVDGEPASGFLPPIPHPHSFHGPAQNRGKMNGTQQPPLTINQVAIMTASQNKLPTSRVKDIVLRVGRHTMSSAKKQGRWYKGDHYVDNANYSWRNMELFIDYQKQMYTPAGTVKATCKK